MRRVYGNRTAGTATVETNAEGQDTFTIISNEGYAPSLLARTASTVVSQYTSSGWSGVPVQTTDRVRGPHGGTLSKVEEVNKLMEGGLRMTEACKRVHIDTRTYQAYNAGSLDIEEE